MTIVHPSPQPAGQPAAFLPAPLRVPSAPRPSRSNSLGRHFLHTSAPPAVFDHTGYADEATLAMGALVHLTHMPWPAVAGAGAAAVLGTGVWAKQMFDHRGVTAFATGTAAASSAWITWAAYDTPWSIGSIAALIGGTFLLGPVYGVCRWRNSKAAQKEIQARVERAAERAEAKQHQFVQILADAGCPDITINTAMEGDEWNNGERKFPAGFSLALNLGKKAPDVAGLAQRIPEIEKIASGSTTYPIRPGAIQVAANPLRAHQCELIVPTKDVLGDTYPMIERVAPWSVNDPLPTAMSVDGTVIKWDCHEDPHGMFAGRTNAGKTTYLNSHIHGTTGAADAVTWLICGEKPVRGLAPWLQPFLQGKADNPVIDWFAADLYEAWAMTKDAITLIQRRQESAAATGKDRWEATPETPEVFVFIDESPDLLGSTERFPLESPEEDPDNPGKYLDYTGPYATFAELLLKGIRLGRSEGVHFVFLAQRATVTMLGSEGGDTKSQVSYRAGFNASGTIDANAVFNTQTAGINVESLPQGALYVEMTGSQRPVLAKGLWQSQDDIRRIAVEHAPYCGPIDEWSAETLTFYPDRWTRPGQQEFLRKLCPNPVRTVPGESARTQEPAAQTVEEPRLVDELKAEYQRWMTDNHPGDKPSEDTVTEFFNTLYNDDQDGKQEEIDRLEALFAADSAVEPAQQVRRIDPSLPEDTRVLLEVIAASDLLFGGEYVLAVDLLPIAESLGWEASESAGGRRIAQALKKVNVFVVEPRPRVNGKKRQVYRTADLRAAVEKNTV